MSIYDEIGGPEAVHAAVDQFYERVLADPLLAPYFEGIEMKRLKGHQRAFIAAAIGGPDRYVGRSMGAAHAGLDITPEAFAHVVDHLVETLTSLGVPDSTIAAIGSKLAPLEAQVVTSRVA
jgi:hemoglobin